MDNNYNYQKKSKAPVAVMGICGVIMIALIVVAIMTASKNGENGDASGQENGVVMEAQKPNSANPEIATLENIGVYGHIEMLDETTENVIDVDAISEVVDDLLSTTETPVSSSGDYLTVVNCSEYVTLRSRDDIDGSEITKVNYGEQVRFLDYAGKGFYKVDYYGTTGYILGSYLTEPQEEQLGYFTTIVNCNQSVTLRKTPSQKGDEICQVPLGAEIIYYQSANNAFCFISYDGRKGFVLEEYVR